MTGCLVESCPFLTCPPKLTPPRPLLTPPTPLPCALLQFVSAVMARWPSAVLQFEDFSINHAVPLLERYRKHHLVFNDGERENGVC